MKKLLKHSLQILLGGMIIALFCCVDLNDYPIMHSMDYVFWAIMIIILPIALFYCWRHKTCFLLGMLLWMNPVMAGEYTVEICNYYQGYKQRIEAYRQDHFAQDEPCDEAMWDKARKEAQEYKTSLTDFIVPTYGITRSIANNINEWFDGSCANDLMKMCSAYQSRHPETVTKTVPVILYEAVGKLDANGRATSCWPCDMAYVVFVVIQALSNNLCGLMASVAYMALIWGTVFWLLFKAFGMVLTSKGGTYFSQIAGGLLAVFIAAWFLRNDGRNLSYLYSQFLSPVMQVGLSFADGIQSSVGLNSPAFRSITGSSQPFYQQLKEQSAPLAPSRPNFTDYCGDSSSSGGVVNNLWNQVSRWAFPGLETNFSQLTAEAGRADQTLLTDELKSQFLCMTQRFYNQSLPLIATGQSLISFATHDTDDAIEGYETSFPKKFKMWVMGVLLVGVFTYFSFLVAFRIMDIFLRLGFVLVLMPLFVTAVVFKVTRDYALKAWNFLFHIIVEFIGLAISASFVMIMLEGIMASNRTQLLNVMAAPYTGDYGENLFNAITSNMTLSFPLLLLAVVILGEKLMTVFPMIIATLFGVPDSSSKGSVGTMIAGTVGGVAQRVRSNFQAGKKDAEVIAKNSYKTKETKAKEAEKDLNDKKRKLEEEKRKPNNEKNIKKAQKDVDDAQKKATAFRAQADAEKAKTDPSNSRYAARRWGYDSGNAVRKGGGVAAEAVDKFGSKWGGFLMKSGVGAIVGVPLVLGAKTISTGIRAGARTAEVGLKASGRLGATAQKIGYKFMGKAPPPRKPKP